jgi:histidinol dehydrogenase
VRPVPLTRSGIAAAVAGLRPAAEQDRAVAQTVAELVADVRSRGDAALVAATARFDWPDVSVDTLRVPVADLDAAYSAVSAELLDAFAIARENLLWFHRHELRSDWEGDGPFGQRLGIRYRPVGRAGLYVPGGLGSYASTVLMNAIPAQVAGVPELFVCTPPGRDGRVNESVLAAARFVGIDEVYRVGGAQAIAAMAFGTQTVARADVISGPGNAYVMEAKRQVYGAVGIDGLAGPSEVVVVADDAANPEWVAADLLAQEEHGSGASAVLVAESPEFCARVAAALDDLRTREGAAPNAGGLLFAFYPAATESRPFAELAAAFVDAYAPEHLEIQTADPEAFLAAVTVAGAIFIGGWTPTAFGDYLAGSNHVLPTGGAARFSSPLSVDTFVRKSSVLAMSPRSVLSLTPHLGPMATSEGLAFHRVSAELRAAGVQPAPDAGDAPAGDGER